MIAESIARLAERIDKIVYKASEGISRTAIGRYRIPYTDKPNGGRQIRPRLWRMTTRESGKTISQNAEESCWPLQPARQKRPAKLPVREPAVSIEFRFIVRSHQSLGGDKRDNQANGEGASAEANAYRSSPAR